MRWFCKAIQFCKDNPKAVIGGICSGVIGNIFGLKIWCAIFAIIVLNATITS